MILADGQHQTQTFHFRPKLKGSGGYCVSGTLMNVEGRMGHSALEQTLEPVAGTITMNSSSSKCKLENRGGSCWSKRHDFDELAVRVDAIGLCDSVLCIRSSW